MEDTQKKPKTDSKADKNAKVKIFRNDLFEIDDGEGFREDAMRQSRSRLFDRNEAEGQMKDTFMRDAEEQRREERQKEKEAQKKVPVHKNKNPFVRKKRPAQLSYMGNPVEKKTPKTFKKQNKIKTPKINVKKVQSRQSERA